MIVITLLYLNGQLFYRTVLNMKFGGTTITLKALLKSSSVSEDLAFTQSFTSQGHTFVFKYINLFKKHQHEMT